MKNIKLVALDMDGTLFNDHGEISQKDRDALQRAADEGVAVAIATGRAYSELPVDMLYEIGVRYAITGNGSGVYRLPKVDCVYSDCLDNEVVYEIIEELKQLDVYYDVYIEGLVYCPKSVCHNIRKMDMSSAMHEHVERTRIVVDDLVTFMKSFGKHVEKATVNFALLEDGTLLGRKETAEILDKYPQIQYLCGGYHNWEFTKSGVDKGSGIRFLAEKIGISVEETMACGDSQNDLSMLKVVGTAVAMENATEEVKDVCHFISKSNSESGVAYAMEQLIFEKK